MQKISHPVQLGIVKKLLYLSEARFSDLNDTDLTNDHFTFHIKKLIQDGFIEKTQIGYKLTKGGLLYASNLDLDNLEIPHIKVGVKLCIVRKVKNETEVLLGERLRDPFKGIIGFHTQKVRPDESVFNTAKRCLLNETGLEGDFEYAGLEHTIEKSKDALNSSTMMNYIRVLNVRNELIYETKESRNTWIKLNDIAKIKNTYIDILDDFKLFQRKDIFFVEKER